MSQREVSIHIGLNQLQEAIHQLSTPAKLDLVRQLEAETRKTRWNQLFQSIDQKLKGRRFSMKEINAEIAAFRRAKRAARPH